jgi:NTP pyrophosphatase (non-canonical NTP hydrolase)
MKNLNLNNLTEIILDQARTKGFGTKPEEINVGEKIALIHSEVSEAYEAYRHKNIDGKDGFKEELGDVVQRILHLCGIFGIDIEAEILKKVEFNKDRVWNFDKMNEKNSLEK